jgi:hypothetical protein
MSSTLSGVVFLLAAKLVSADYWLPCQNAVKSSTLKDWCLVELNYNQYNSSAAGGTALINATQADLRRISYSGSPTVHFFCLETEIPARFFAALLLRRIPPYLFRAHYSMRNWLTPLSDEESRACLPPSKIAFDVHTIA